LKSSDRIVDRPVDRRRLVDRPGRASGSAADVAGRSSGRRLVADRPVGFVGWTSICSLFLMQTLALPVCQHVIEASLSIRRERRDR